MAGPLDGVRILDCTTVVLGPWASQQLGDFGADVIKVEPPAGDTTRQLGPRRNKNMSAFYLGCNRNKRSIVLDLKQDEGRAALMKLAESSDIFMHNYRPEPAARLGVSYEAFAAVNPRLIYLATYGYRADGPMGPRAAYDDIIQAGSGLTDLQRVIADEPRFLPSIVCDKTSSAGVVAAILAALYERERSGQGQAIEVPMFESLVSFVMVEHMYGETFKPKLDSAGYKRLLSKERRPYPSKDGYFALLPYTDRHWREFATLVGRPQILDDPRFASLSVRLDNIEVVYATLAEVCATRTNKEWVALLSTSNVPHGPVNTLEDLFDDEQLAATGYWQEMDHPTEGSLRVAGIATRFSRTEPQIRRHQPNLGEHSVEILEEAGYTSAQVEAMMASGITAGA
jgi:crotonobetainyl-CoA:carnitine CoA-transferase CaiB-like acyl-CoA transferase